MIKDIKAILALFFACFFLTSPIFSAKKKNNRKNNKISKKSIKELENIFIDNETKNIKNFLNCTNSTSHNEFKSRIVFLLKYIEAQDNFIEAIQSFAQTNGYLAKCSLKGSNYSIDTLDNLFSKEAPIKLIVTCLKHGTLLRVKDNYCWIIDKSIKELAQQEIDDIAKESGEKFTELIKLLKKCYIMAKIYEQNENNSKALTSHYKQILKLQKSSKAKSCPKVIQKCLHFNALFKAILDYTIVETQSQQLHHYNHVYPHNDNDIILKHYTDNIYRHYQNQKPEFDVLKKSALNILKTKQEQPRSTSSELESTSSEPRSISSKSESSLSQNSLSIPANNIDYSIINDNIIENYHERIVDWFKYPEQTLIKQDYTNPYHTKFAPPHAYSQIIKHHNFAVIVDNYIKALGIRAEWKNNNRRTISYNIPGEIIYNHNNEKEIGAFSYGINDDNTCYHRSFSKRVYKDIAYLINKRIFDAQFPILESLTASLKTIPKTESHKLELLENDKSHIIKEDHYAITIADPKNNMTILLYKVAHK